MRELLDVWPALPINIESIFNTASLIEGADNIVAALEHNDRVCYVDLEDVPSPLMERFAAAMQQPFPELTHLTLSLWSDDETMPVLPETFFGGSAPRLRYCEVDYLPFPALQKLVLSAGHHLVHLSLLWTPHSGYDSPEAVVNCLSAMTNLEQLSIGFRSHPEQRLSPLTRTRTIFHALTHFTFVGASEYLEDFVSRIDAPQLFFFIIQLFHQHVFDVSQLNQFIGRTDKLRAFDTADVTFRNDSASVTLPREAWPFDLPKLRLAISCDSFDWQLLSMTQICGSLPSLPTLEHLHICEELWQPYWHDDMDNTQWLDFLYPFTAVKNLYLSKRFALYVMAALQELAKERVMDVLPALQNLYLEGLQPSGPVQAAIGQFVVARQLSDHPVTVEHWL